MGNVLVIDDLRVFKDEGSENVVYARTPKEAIEQLKKDILWSVIVLDHDMGFDYHEDTFLDIWPVIEFLEERKEDFGSPEFWIVTSNPVAAQRMQAALDEAGLYNTIIPESEKSMVFTYLDW